MWGPVADHASTYVIRDCMRNAMWARGVVRNHAIQAECNVRHGTGYVRTMWGACAAQFALSYIEYCPLPHPKGDMMVFGALYTCPLQAEPHAFFRYTSTYTSGKYHRILRMQVNS